TFGGKFCARLRYKNLEIHKVFLRFLRLGGHKICSPTARVALISVSLDEKTLFSPPFRGRKERHAAIKVPSAMEK
ncbi:MAG: hypothetical protein IJU29_03440, partial [Oscillospiraceae bacterium]|nr:hypothetical protein [Oscillospiraceae bacterium]